MIAKMGIVGINGFGATHGRIILNLIEKGDLQCKAFADIKVDTEDHIYRGLIENGAKHYTDYKEMLQNHSDLDFVVISTPIALHTPMAVETLSKGFNVLLEKPPAVTIQDIDKIINASEKANKLCAVNFQMTSLRTFRELNEIIAKGELGKIDRVVGVGLWKRTDSYYERNPWAGKLIHNNEYVLDGTINNPLAHLLNNCLIVAGEGDAQAAMPKRVQAELYKGHNIEGEDTACVRVCTENDVEVLFYTTLCNFVQETPYIIVYGDKGKAIWSYDNDLNIEYSSGDEQVISYGREIPMENIYYNFISVIRGDQKRLLSSARDCRSFVLASNGAFESSQDTMKISDEYIIREDEEDTVTTYIKDIEDIVASAIQENKLFSELPVSWARKTKPFDLDNYRLFRLFR